MKEHDYPLIKRFLSLTKPGIIFGNLITVLGGFFLGSRTNINYGILIATVLGISLIIASGCVVNNYIDRDIDKLMDRTKNRVLAQGLISGKTALLYAFILGILGILILSLKTNLLTVLIAILGLFVYVVIYSLWLKRRSLFGTIVGSISGSVPPVVGYCAVTNRFDLGAALLFLILTFWQMPHSYAIGIYRLNDYKSANIPILPVKKGIHTTKIHMFIYIILFIVATLLLSICNYTGWLYFVVAAALGFSWLYFSISGFKNLNNKIWARKMFLFSILSIMILSIMMSLDVIAR